MKSWSEGTIKSYSSYLVRWENYCKENSVDPFQASIEQGAEFLVQLFKSTGNGYSALNTARSALSAVILPKGGITFGNQPLIQRLMKGIFKERSSLPKYTVTYDVKIIFDYMRTLDFTSLSLELVTKCLATLLGLLTGQRSQTLASLSINHMYLDESKAVFYIPVLLKQSRPKYHQQPLEIVAYDKRICPIDMIRKYVEITEENRLDNHSKFFLSYSKPFKPVSSTTIARWVTDILSRAGINTTTFTAHSTRSASTSKAKQTNLSISEIMKAAGWSSERTFATFYKKPILHNYGSSILD